MQRGVFFEHSLRTKRTDALARVELSPKSNTAGKLLCRRCLATPFRSLYQDSPFAL